MPRTKKAARSAGKQLGVRLAADLVEMLDAEVARQRAASPGALVGYADVIRTALYKVLPPLPTERKGT